MTDHESFEALPIANSEHRQEQEGGDENGGHHHDEEEEKEEQWKRVSDEPSIEIRCFKPAVEAEPRESNSETLRVPSSLESVMGDQSADLQANSTRQMDGKAESKESIVPSDKEIITREAVQAAQNQKENQLQLSICSTPLSKLSPSSVTQSLSSVPSSAIPKQTMSPKKINNVHVLEADRKNSSGCKTSSAVSVARTSASDGYNWRKYGQKRVKHPTGSRSYYRCSHSDCCAKKIECYDYLGHVIEIIYRSQHSHEPLWKTNSNRKIKFMSSNEPTVENSFPEQPIRVLNDSDPSPSSKEPLQEVLCSADKQGNNSSGPSENGQIIIKEEHVDEPKPKRSVKKGDLTYLDSHVKPGKKSKFVVHAARDVGISSDGYRWRKYGQKMVKGNPHPREIQEFLSSGVKLCCWYLVV